MAGSPAPKYDKHDTKAHLRGSRATGRTKLAEAVTTGGGPQPLGTSAPQVWDPGTSSGWGERYRPALPTPQQDGSRRGSGSEPADPPHFWARKLRSRVRTAQSHSSKGWCWHLHPPQIISSQTVTHGSSNQIAHQL